MYRISRILMLLIVTAALHAEDPGLDDLLGGFDQELEVDLSAVAPDQEDSTGSAWFSIYGNLDLSTSYNYAHEAPAAGQTDYRGLSRARTKFDVTTDMTFLESWKAKLELKTFYDAIYGVRGRENYTDDVLGTYESEIQIKEAYLQGSLSKNYDVKLGRQIIVWGKSDNLRVTDVINPMDNREMGMVDIEDLRLPVVMSKFDYYTGAWNLSAIFIHESRVQIEPGFGSDYFPLDMFPLPGGNLPPVEYPDSDLENTQFAAAVNGRFRGWDIAVYAADVLDSRWHLATNDDNVQVREYSRIRMYGSAYNIALGDWLVKLEAALLDNLAYSKTDDTKQRLDVLVGTEYAGITDTTISFEAANRHIYDYETSMLDAPDFAYENEQQIAFRASHKFNHEKGLITLLVNHSFSDGNNLGGFLRLWLDYDLTDDLSYSVGIVDYAGGEKNYFKVLQDNDRIFATIQLNF